MTQYQNITLYNKDGYEIPLLTTSNIIFTDATSLDSISEANVVLYGYYDGDSSINVKIINSGEFKSSDSRFISENDSDVLKVTLNAFIDSSIIYNCANISSVKVDLKKLYNSNSYNDNTDANNDDYILYAFDENPTTFEFNIIEYINSDELLLPSAVFIGDIEIEKTSVGLIGVQTLIFSNGTKLDNDVLSLKELDINDKYYLKISNNDDDSLKFITLKNNFNDEIASDTSIFVDADNNYVNIAFMPTQEGVHEYTIDIFIKSNDPNNSDYIIKVGHINVTCVAEGEDERYRTLFENFGIQHPKTYYKIFKDHDINESNPDYTYINRKSKELFLTYDEIFPYIGTYKALINAIKYLGYDDIYFREWYKPIYENTDKEISYKINLNDNFNDNLTYANVSLDINNQYKKLNKLTMAYSLNSETDELDEYNENIITRSYKYSYDEVLIKLFAF